MKTKKELDDYQKSFIFLVVLSVLLLAIPLYFVFAEVVPTAREIEVWDNGETVEATITDVRVVRSTHRFTDGGPRTSSSTTMVSYEYISESGKKYIGETPVFPYTGKYISDYVGKPLEIKIGKNGVSINYNPRSSMTAIILLHLLPSFIAPIAPMLIWIFIRRKRKAR